MSSNSGGSGALQTLVGLVAVVGIGAASWFLSPFVLNWLNANVSAIAGLTLSDTILRIGTTVVMFVVLMMVFSILLALVSGGDKRSSSEAEIRKDQDARFAKRRQQQGRSGTRKRTKR